jgi:WD40 repeat protein
MKKQNDPVARRGWRGRSVAAAAVGLALLFAASAATGMQLTAWGAAINVSTIAGTDPDFNTPYTDGCPIQSPDGLSFYMASNRPGGQGLLDIWVATRATTDDPWGAPVNLGTPVNSAADDFCPTPTRGNGLFFVSARTVAGACGGPDIYFARNNPARGWTTPQNLGCDVNSAAGEAGPSLVNGGGGAGLYFSSTRPGGFDDDAAAAGDSDIYFSPLASDGSFGVATLVGQLSTEFEDARPNVRKDGLEIVFDSTRTGTLGGSDIYTATRDEVTDSWGVPVNLGSNVNSAASETRASFAWDGLTLFFGSTRPGSELAPDGVTVSNDVYTTTRQQVTGQG